MTFDFLAGRKHRIRREGGERKRGKENRVIFFHLAPLKTGRRRRKKEGA